MNVAEMKKTLAALDLQLIESLNRFEAVLVRLDIRMVFRHYFPRGTGCAVAFVPLGDKWRLVFEDFSKTPTRERRVTPIVDIQQADDRVRAALALPALVNSIPFEMRQQIARFKRTIEETEALIDAVQKSA